MYGLILKIIYAGHSKWGSQLCNCSNNYIYIILLYWLSPHHCRTPHNWLALILARHCPSTICCPTAHSNAPLTPVKDACTPHAPTSIWDKSSGPPHHHSVGSLRCVSGRHNLSLNGAQWAIGVMKAPVMSEGESCHRWKGVYPPPHSHFLWLTTSIFHC